MCKEGVFFSIIVPVYNVSQYLDRCMTSLLQQRNAEILLIDDGSTDISGEICDKYASLNKNVQVYHKVNGGLSSARNYGIAHAKGEYLLFVDSDDYVSDGMCSTLERMISAYSQMDMIAFGAFEVNGEENSDMRRIPPEEPLAQSGHDYLLDRYQNWNMNVQAWMYAYRRNFLIDNDLFFKEGILHEDVEFTPRVLLKAKQVVSIPEQLYYYIVRENSISTSKDKTKNIRDLFGTLEEQCHLAEIQEPELRKWMLNSILNSYLNMVQEARMYQPKYRKMLKKAFLWGKSATWWNRFRVLICTVSVRGYCWMNDFYKKRKA